MNESEFQRIFNYHLYPRDSRLHSDGGFVKIDNSGMAGTHWTCFVIKGNKAYYFDSFGGQPDKFLPNQLPKPIIYHNYKIQDINSKLIGPYSLYFFYLNERLIYYDTILNMYFD